MRLFRASPVIFGELGIAEYGTPALVDLMRQRRMAPTENFRKTVFADSGNYSGPAIRRDFGAKKDGCYGCPIQCKKSTPKGEHLPEYETVSHFGALNGIADLHAIVRANTLCNELGIDTITAAATLSAWGRRGDASRRPRKWPGCLPILPGAVERGSCSPSVPGGSPKLSADRSSP